MSLLRNLGVGQESSRPSAGELEALNFLWQLSQGKRPFAHKALAKDLAQRFGCAGPSPPTGPMPRVQSLEGRVDLLAERLSRAMAERRSLDFTYNRPSRRTRKRHRVSPWGLGMYEGSWYLVGLDLDRAEVRIYRLSRMSSLAVGKRPGTYEVPANFSFRNYVGPPAWTYGKALRKVHLELDESVSWALEGIPLEFCRKRRSRSGKVAAELRVGDTEALACFVMGLAGGARVKGPKDVRHLVARRARRLLKEGLP